MSALRPPPARLDRAAWGLAAVLAASGCSLLFDTTATQCTRDSDCAIHQAVCNKKTEVCVPKPMPSVTVTTSERDAGVEDADAEPESPDAFDSAWPCNRAKKPVVRLQGDLSGTDRLICANDYLLVGNVFVKPGVVLTIDPGTSVFADPATHARLIVQPGGRLVADGFRQAPIVFTSGAPPADRRAGDWGGLVLLGRATGNAAQLAVNGLAEAGGFGGADDADASGVLRYVRIEYADTGLTLGAVGHATPVNFLDVRKSADACFRFIGGAVHARHLVCQHPGSHGFVFTNGYRGKLQFLVVQGGPRPATDAHGFDGENDAVGSTAGPYTDPQIFNATICGRRFDAPADQFGVRLRRGARAHIVNSLFVGFDVGVDVRDGGTELDVRSSVFADPIAMAESAAKQLLAPARQNTVGAPNIGDCFDPLSPGLRPSPAIRTGASKPPTDGFFDPQANFIGAFRDVQDDWTKGAWLLWSDR